jgi:hypothetical protein
MAETANFKNNHSPEQKLEMVADIRYPLADNRQGVGMAVFPPKPGRYPGIPRNTQGQWLAGRVSFHLARHVPCRLERSPSSQRGMYLADCKENLPVNKAGALLSGRFPFQSTRYMYLVDWKRNLPVNKACTLPKPFQSTWHVPCRNPSSQQGMYLAETLPVNKACTLPTARETFQSTRRVPCCLEGFPFSRDCLFVLGYLLNFFKK